MTRRALFVTNGHGEASIAERIAEAVHAADPALEVDHFPLVGEGLGGEAMHEVGPRRTMPSGGLVAMGNVRAFARDLGAGFAALLSQSARCLALIVFLYGSKRGVRWVWPIPGSKVGATAGKLLHLTAPIALSEVLWGMSTFIYTVVFTRLGTTMLAASQIVLSLENMFIVASAGLAPAAVAVIGQALGMGSLPAAKSNAWLTIRFGFLLALALGSLYAGSSLLLPGLYPKVGQEVLHLAFWGVLLMAVTQPAKVLSSVLGNGVLASGGDTRFVLFGNLAGTYAIGLPAAVGLGLLTPFGFFGVFAAKILEEGVKAGCFSLRFLRARWYENALKEEQIAKDEAQQSDDRGNHSQETYAV